MASVNGTNGNGGFKLNAKTIGTALCIAFGYYAYTQGISLFWIAGLVIAGGFLGSTWFNGNHSNGVR